MKKEIERDEFLRKRAIRQKKKKKRRLIAFFCFLIALLVCVGVILCLSVFFPIEKIKITGSDIYTFSQIEKASKIKLGDNLFVVSEKRVEELLRQKLPYVDSIKIKRELPGTLIINVKDADEFSAYYYKENYYLLSKSGWVLEKTAEPPQNVFTVYGVSVKCKVGAPVEFEDSSQKETVDKIADFCDKKEIKLNSVNLTSQAVASIKVEERFEVNLGNINNLEEKIKHLASMIEKIPKNESGKINLSMWTEAKPQGTYSKDKEN